MGPGLGGRGGLGVGGLGGLGGFLGSPILSSLSSVSPVSVGVGVSPCAFAHCAMRVVIVPTFRQFAFTVRHVSPLLNVRPFDDARHGAIVQALLVCRGLDESDRLDLIAAPRL